MPGQKTLQQGEGLSEKTQSRRMRGGKKEQEDPPFSGEGWVRLRATGSNSIAQVMPKYLRGWWYEAESRAVLLRSWGMNLHIQPVPGDF